MRASVGREPVTPEDCGSDCGSGVSSRSARARASVRVASEPYAGAHGRLVEAGAVTIGLVLVDVGMSCHRFVANRVRPSPRAVQRQSLQ